MKTLLAVSLALLCGCSTNLAPLVVRPAVPLQEQNCAQIRLPETIRSYHVGRYADPNNRGLLHEQHSIHRIETASRWNLMPGAEKLAGTPVPNEEQNKRGPNVLFNDVAAAELNRQKLISAQMMAKAERLDVSLAELQLLLRTLKAGIEDAAALRSLVRGLESRLLQLESVQRPSLSPSSEKDAHQPVQTGTNLLRP
jgi:hypothetical protein